MRVFLLRMIKTMSDCSGRRRDEMCCRLPAVEVEVGVRLGLLVRIQCAESTMHIGGPAHRGQAEDGRFADSSLGRLTGYSQTLREPCECPARRPALISWMLFLAQLLPVALRVSPTVANPPTSSVTRSKGSKASFCRSTCSTSCDQAS